MADIEDADPVADRQVLFHQAAHGGIFDRHVPAVEIDHLRAHLAMDGIQGSLANGRGRHGLRGQTGILWRTDRADEVGVTKYGTMREIRGSTDLELSAGAGQFPWGPSLARDRLEALGAAVDISYCDMAISHQLTRIWMTHGAGNPEPMDARAFIGTNLRHYFRVARHLGRTPRGVSGSTGRFLDLAH